MLSYRYIAIHAVLSSKTKSVRHHKKMKNMRRDYRRNYHSELAKGQVGSMLRTVVISYLHVVAI